MVICEACKAKIGNNDLKAVFHFTLGNWMNGRFYGNKTIYYHIDCLNGKKDIKQELLAPLN